MNFGMIMWNQNMVECKILLYGYRQTHCIYKNKRYLQRRCRRCWNKAWHFKVLELDKQLPKGKNKGVIGLMRDDLGGQIMKEFVGLRAKIHNYLKDNNDEDKKRKKIKRCVIKRKL